MKYIIKNIIPAAALALAGSHRSQPLHRAEP